MTNSKKKSGQQKKPKLKTKLQFKYVDRRSSVDDSTIQTSPESQQTQVRRSSLGTLPSSGTGTKPKPGNSGHGNATNIPGKYK